jgi:hypothetical protein
VDITTLNPKGFNLNKFLRIVDCKPQVQGSTCGEWR